MSRSARYVLAAATLIGLGLPQAAWADNIDFGDDASQFAKDGECDDMRFSGEGMTDTLLIDSDIRHDATDCRTAYEQGRLTYNGGHRNGGHDHSGHTGRDSSRIIWGDDSSKYAKDGECDDKRFEGPGMTDTPLLDSDIKHDATDCRVAYEQDRLQVRQ
jgi:hypothetical protein